MSLIFTDDFLPGITLCECDQSVSTVVPTGTTFSHPAASTDLEEVTAPQL